MNLKIFNIKLNIWLNIGSLFIKKVANTLNLINKWGCKLMNNTD